MANEQKRLPSRLAALAIALSRHRHLLEPRSFGFGLVAFLRPLRWIRVSGDRETLAAPAALHMSLFPS